MHQKYIDHVMNQISEPRDLNIAETKEVVADITQEKEVDIKHPEIRGSDAKSDLSVEDHPEEIIEYHESSQEVSQHPEILCTPTVVKIRHVHKII